MNNENNNNDQQNDNAAAESEEQSESGDEKVSGTDTKNVDEEWKQQVQQEKEELKGQQEEPKEEYPEASFSTIIGGIGIQAAIALGQVENPATGEKTPDLEQAKHFIDSLKVLQEKTEGNLTQQEENHLTSLVSELQMQYVQRVKSSGGDVGDESSGESGGTQTGQQGAQNIYTPPGTS